LTFRNHSIQPRTGEDVCDEIECFSHNVVLLRYVQVIRLRKLFITPILYFST